MKISRGMQGKRNAIGSAARLFHDPAELAEFKRRKPLTARVKQAISRSLKGKRRKRFGFSKKGFGLWVGNPREMALAATAGGLAGVAVGRASHIYGKRKT